MYKFWLTRQPLSHLADTACCGTLNPLSALKA